MITQKQALKNVLDTIDNEVIRYQAVFNWLGDINWHTEAKLLSEKLSEYQILELETLEELDYVLNSNNYDSQFITEFKASHPEAVKAVTESEGLIFYHGYVFSRSQLMDFKIAQTFYRTFNQIFSWGLQNDGWSCSHGDLLVAELITLLSKEKEVNND